MANDHQMERQFGNELIKSQEQEIRSFPGTHSAVRQEPDWLGDWLAIDSMKQPTRSVFNLMQGQMRMPFANVFDRKPRFGGDVERS